MFFNFQKLQMKDIWWIKASIWHENKLWYNFVPGHCLLSENCLLVGTDKCLQSNIGSGHFLCSKEATVYMYVQSCDLYAVVFQTLCALVRAVYRKRLGDHGFDVINILIGFDAAEAQMQVFCYDLQIFIQ